MSCPTIHSGERFLATSLAQIDCQAKTIGSFGYGALADPGSTTSLALTGLLTLFVALFGMRMLLGRNVTGHDLVSDVLRVAIVLTLATSWPAWRIIGYDLVINGPAQIANAIGQATGLPGSNGDLAERLQRVDDGLSALNYYGSGRLGVAGGDWFQLGFARSAFLTGTLGSLALVRLVAGILLAIAPLIAGLMLFGVTRSIFIGWARGLVMTFLASITLALILGAQLALLEPWLQDALARRLSDQKILDAPVEILVVTLAFALVCFGALAIIARIAFHPENWIAQLIPAASPSGSGGFTLGQGRTEQAMSAYDSASRARSLSISMSESLRRESLIAGSIAGGSGTISPASASAEAARSGRGQKFEAGDSLGTSYRRSAQRVSAASKRRDQS